MRVAVLGATISPGKKNHYPWDGMGDKINEETFKKISKLMLGANPYAAVTAYIGTIAMSATAKPDAGGKALMFGGGAEMLPPADSTINLSKNQDSFTPSWGMSVVWRHVLLTKKTRLQLDVWDFDLSENDSIGNVSIGYKELKAALDAGKSLAVAVDDQTDSQLLFVKIDVSQE